MKKFKTRYIAIKTSKGPMSVEALCLDGLAYHPDVLYSSDYVVTHIESGLALISHLTKKEARSAILAALAVEGVDWTKDEAFIQGHRPIYRPSIRAMKAAVRPEVFGAARATMEAQP